MMRKLNIGGGVNPIPGYDVIDRNQGTEAYPLSYEDGIFHEVRASHILEHFERKLLIPVLKEWIRVLKPNGILQISVPDFNWLLQHLEHPLFQAWLMGGQTDENDFHKSLFTDNILRELFALCGLVDVQSWEGSPLDCSGFELSLNLQGMKPV